MNWRNGLTHLNAKNEERSEWKWIEMKFVELKLKIINFCCFQAIFKKNRTSFFFEFPLVCWEECEKSGIYKRISFYFFFLNILETYLEDLLEDRRYNLLLLFYDFHKHL